MSIWTGSLLVSMAMGMLWITLKKRLGISCKSWDREDRLQGTVEDITVRSGAVFRHRASSYAFYYILAEKVYPVNCRKSSGPDSKALGDVDIFIESGETRGKVRRIIKKSVSQDMHHEDRTGFQHRLSLIGNVLR